MSIPIVMRDGNACGLMMTSWVRPESVKGMSVAGHKIDITPFWPWRYENLSPITGLRRIRSVIATRRGVEPEPTPMSLTRSIYAGSESFIWPTTISSVSSSNAHQRAPLFETANPTEGGSSSSSSEHSSSRAPPLPPPARARRNWLPKMELSTALLCT